MWRRLKQAGLALVAAGAVAACSDRTEPDQTTPGGAVATPTAAMPGERLFYPDVPADWPGRKVYLVCLEANGGPASGEAVSVIEGVLQSILDAEGVALPAVVSTPCPFDYPDGELVTRGDPAVFVLQVYLDGDLAQPQMRIGEHFFRGLSNAATPVTFVLRLPASLLDQPAELRIWLATFVGPEPTQYPWPALPERTPR